MKYLKLNRHLLCLIAVVALPYLTAFSQQADLDKTITIVGIDTLLVDVLDEIAEKGGINFSFLNERLPTGKKVTIKAENRSIRSILDELCEDLGMEYQLVEKQVIIKPVKSSSGSDSGKIKPELVDHTISGIVRDGESGELLISANIFVVELSTGTITNPYGFYSLTLPEGNYNLEFSYLGYLKSNQEIVLDQSRKINIDMGANKELLQAVEVVASSQDNHIEGTRTSQVELKTKAVNQIPGMMGEKEIIKSLHSRPWS